MYVVYVMVLEIFLIVFVFDYLFSLSSLQYYFVTFLLRLWYFPYLVIFQPRLTIDNLRTVYY
jgi:hypothetical protein